MTVPYIFANATGSLPLSELDTNFAYLANGVGSATGNITFSNTTLSTLNTNTAITIATVNGNTTYGWQFNPQGTLTLPGVDTINAVSGADIYSTRPIKLYSNSNALGNITLVANGASGSGTWIFDSNGNLSASGNVYAQYFNGGGQDIILEFNPTIIGINANVGNTNSNVANLVIDIANTNSNVANTNSNVANLTLVVANNSANIALLQAGNYSNANVANFLPGYTGNFNSIGNATITGGLIATTANITGDAVINGNLTVHGTQTVIDSVEIVTNDISITLANNIGAGQLINFNDAGIRLGNTGVITWLYNYDTASWQSNVNITPASAGNFSLGTPTLPWSNIYSNQISIVGNVVANNIVANIVTNNFSYTGNIISLPYVQVRNDVFVDGNLFVAGNTTTVDAVNITTDDKVLILANNAAAATGTGAGIQLGNTPFAKWTYNYTANAWVTDIDVTPNVNGVLELGHNNYRWSTVYANNSVANTVIATDVTATGNVIGNVILSNDLISAVGNIESNAYILGNGFYLTGLPQRYGNSNVANYLPVYSGNFTANIISTTGNIETSANISAGGDVYAYNYSAAGVITANTVNALVNVSAVGNVDSGNVNTAGNVSSAGTVIANTIISLGDVSAVGNIHSANFNGNLTGNDIVANNVTANTFTGTLSANANAQPNITSVGTLLNLNVAGNIVSDTVTANIANIVDIIGANVSVTGNIYSEILISNTVTAVEVTGTLTTAAQPNITSVGLLTDVSTSGNIEVYGLITATGNISSNSYILGNGRYLTGMPELYGNSNVANYLPTYSGNFTVGNISATGNITINASSYFLGNGTYLTGVLHDTGNIEFNNTIIYSLDADADITISPTNGAVGTAITVPGGINGPAGTPLTVFNSYNEGLGDTPAVSLGASSAYDVTVYGDGSLSTTGNVTVGGVLLSASQDIAAGGNIGAAGNASVTGTITVDGAANLGNSVSIVGSVSVDTDVSVAGNITVDGLTNLGNSVSIVGSVSVDTDVSVTGNITTANSVLISGLISATGNITTANSVLISGSLSATGNAQAGNITTTGLISATGNAQAGNIATDGVISVAGNAVLGNVYTSGLVSVTGNVSVDGVVSAAGNIVSNSFILGNAYYATGISKLANSGYVLSLGNTGVITLPESQAGYISIRGSGNVQINTNSNIWTFNSNITFPDSTVQTTAFSNVAVANYLPSYSGVLTSVGNIAANGYIRTSGDISAQGTVSASGNIHTEGYFVGNFLGNITGNLSVAGSNTQVLYNQMGNVAATAGMTFAAGTGNTPNLFTVLGTANITSEILTSAVSASGNITANVFLGDGSQLANVVANVDHLINGSYYVTLNSSGGVELPAVGNTQQTINGTVINISGDPFPGYNDVAETSTIWTASSANVVGFKMTVRVEVVNVANAITNLEMVDITSANDGTGDVSYTITNRVKTNPSAPNTEFTVNLDLNNKLEVNATNNGAGPEYYTYSVTEFNRSTTI